jgi:ketosteroid isomerase-like protein
VADKSLTELIRIYFKAYETKDRSALESTLSDDFTFTSPHDAISTDTAHR